MVVDVRRVLAPNPGPMTLDGTNTWVISSSGGTVLIDPGPDDASHVDALAELRPDLVLITHHHPDHTDAIDPLRERTRVSVRAFDPVHSRDAEPLVHGESITIGDARITVIHTPGHTADSVSLLIADEHDTELGMATGDMILGRGSTVIAAPDGDLAQYFSSMGRILAQSDQRLLPGHGDAGDSVHAVARALVDHRHERLGEVRAALAVIGARADARDPALVSRVTDLVYRDIDGRLRFAAEQSMLAQLAFLAEESA